MSVATMPSVGWLQVKDTINCAIPLRLSRIRQQRANGVATVIVVIYTSSRTQKLAVLIPLNTAAARACSISSEVCLVLTLFCAISSNSRTSS